MSVYICACVSDRDNSVLLSIHARQCVSCSVQKRAWGLLNSEKWVGYETASSCQILVSGLRRNLERKPFQYAWISS